jgi:hypothetical protein
VAGRFSRALAGLRKAIAATARRVPHVIADALGFAGAGAIAYGAWLIYVPAGFLGRRRIAYGVVDADRP